MKMFITGGSGFIGSNYIRHCLRKEGAHVLNYDKITYAGTGKNLKDVKINSKSTYKFVKGDIIDKATLNDSILDFKPDLLIHFAAESHVDRSIDSPKVFLDTNIFGTFNILQSIKEYISNSKNTNFKFIHISTDEVFGSTNDNFKFTEKSPYRPNSPYSASKASSDHLVRSWNRTFNVPSIILNCSNNYGPYQFPEKLIPLVIANTLDQKSIPVYGNGLNVRDWLYVKDNCDAIDSVAEKGLVGETYNIGSNNEMSNIKIVKIICETLDELKPRQQSKSYKDLITFVQDRPGHDFKYAIDSTKITKSLSWNPKTNFREGILSTIKWYLENEKWWRTIQQNTYKQKRLGLL